MSNFRPKLLFAAGKDAVAGASYSPKKLMLLHAGISAGVGFLIALLTYFLDLGMAQAGGLSGMTHLAVLETVQMLLSSLLSILSPFWALGFVAAAIRLARRETAMPHSLLTGLRRWAPALRMLLTQGLIYIGVMTVFAEIGSFIYMLTPLFQPFNDLMQQLSISGTADIEALQNLLLEMDFDALLNMALTMGCFLFLPGLIVIVLLSYRMRLAPYLLMDEPRCGAVYAILMSFRLTKKHSWELFRLDLHFWWFYLLDGVIAVLCYGELILPLMGVNLGIDPVLASFLFYALALALQVGLYVWQKPQIFATYALFYDALLPRQEEEPEETEETE